MTQALSFRPEARAELLDAQRWYDDRMPGLGTEFGLAVATAAAGILRFPTAYPTVHGDIRKAVLRRFPYALLYSVLPDRIEVLAAFHHRRNPVSWRSRT